MDQMLFLEARAALNAIAGDNNSTAAERVAMLEKLQIECEKLKEIADWPGRGGPVRP